jgi:hypothetical protein
MLTVNDAKSAYRFLTQATETELFLMWQNLQQDRITLIIKQIIFSEKGMFTYEDAMRQAQVRT